MNQLTIKQTEAKIAAYLGLVPVDNFYGGEELQKAGLPFSYGAMGNGASDLNFHTSLDWIMVAVDKIENETGYIMSSAPFIDDENGGLTGEYFCVFIYQSTNLNGIYYVDVTGCSSRKEAIFEGVGEFLDKYFNQDEKNRRIKEKREGMMSEIDKYLLFIWTQVGCDNPNNADDIIAFIYDDICDTAEEVNSGTVATGLRRWIEAQ